jgi:class 3 adenylate cyclase
MFLIADVRGYTAFTQERGDEDAARLMGRFAQVTRSVGTGNTQLAHFRRLLSKP